MKEIISNKKTTKKANNLLRLAAHIFSQHITTFNISVIETQKRRGELEPVWISGFEVADKH